MADNEHNPLHAHDDHGHGVGHIVPIKLLVVVGVVLLILTWITVAATYFDLGDGNIYIALAIAVIKASLVALFFMHLRWDRPFNGFIFVGSIAFVALFIAFALTDSSQYQPDIKEYRITSDLKGGDSVDAQKKLEETAAQLQTDAPSAE